MTLQRKPSLYRTITPSVNCLPTIFPFPLRTALRALVRDMKNVVLQKRGGGQAVPKSGGPVLFSGPSGAGKTLAAQLLAKELHTKLVLTNFTNVKGRYIGETEKNLSRVFAAASKRGAVLFFDEADSIYGKRISVNQGHRRYANQEVSYVLQRLDSYPGLVVIFGTRTQSAVSPVLKRRIKHVIRFPSTFSLQTNANFDGLRKAAKTTRRRSMIGPE